MAGLSEILEIARRALNSQRLGINITSHNIANASTAGFSRQRLTLKTTLPQQTTFGLLGTGVTVGHIGRIRERFIDQQVWTAGEAMGESSMHHRILSQVEAAFNEPSDTGLGASLTRFFNAFQRLATHPEESAARNGIVQQGLLLTQSFQRLRTSIAQLRSDLSNDIQSKVDRINQLSREISQLDIEITNAVAVGLDPSDARDQRDLRIDELSKLANIKVSEDERGSVMVSIGGAVIASRAGAVAITMARSGDQISIVGTASGKTLNVSSGELGGLLGMHNSTLADYVARLDQVASALITRVNEVHESGFGLGTPPSTGVPLFIGTSAQDIQINPAIVDDINLIAASQDGNPGDNRIARALAAVGDEQLLAGNSLSIPQFYNSIVSGLGTMITAADNTVRSRELILAQLENQRMAVSGVSLDEEMVNMIKYQRAFEASARVVSSVDEMFLTIINMV